MCLNKKKKFSFLTKLQDRCAEGETFREMYQALLGQTFLLTITRHSSCPAVVADLMVDISMMFKISLPQRKSIGPDTPTVPSVSCWTRSMMKLLVLLKLIWL